MVLLYFSLCFLIILSPFHNNLLTFFFSTFHKNLHTSSFLFWDTRPTICFYFITHISYFVIVSLFFSPPFSFLPPTSPLFFWFFWKEIWVKTEGVCIKCSQQLKIYFVNSACLVSCQWNEGNSEDLGLSNIFNLYNWRMSLNGLASCYKHLCMGLYEYNLFSNQLLPYTCTMLILTNQWWSFFSKSSTFKHLV